MLTLVGGVETKFEGDKCFHQDNYFAQRIGKITRFLEKFTPSPSFEFDDDNVDVYGRVLQVLCGIETKLPYEFWHTNLQHSPTLYAMLCFSGALNNSPDDGIRILPHIDWSDSNTRNRMITPLAMFYFQNREDQSVIGAIDKMKSELPRYAKGVFREAKKDALNYT